MGGGFTPSADQFRAGGAAPTGNDKTDQALQALLGSRVAGNRAVDAAIMQPTATPDAPAPAASTSPSFSDFAKGQESAALGTASADPAVSEAANAASTGGSAGFDIGSIMPYVQMAAQVGGAISEANRPQPVALHIGHMGGYNSTVPDSVERLRQMLAQMQRGRR